jgi:hypothetical protein
MVMSLDIVSIQRGADPTESACRDTQGNKVYRSNHDVELALPAPSFRPDAWRRNCAMSTCHELSFTADWYPCFRSFTHLHRIPPACDLPVLDLSSVSTLPLTTHTYYRLGWRSRRRRTRLRERLLWVLNLLTWLRRGSPE